MISCLRSIIGKFLSIKDLASFDISRSVVTIYKILLCGKDFKFIRRPLEPVGSMDMSDFARRMDACEVEAGQSA